MFTRRTAAIAAGVLSALALVLVAAFAGGAAAQTAGPATAANQTFPDPTGDAQGGPDLTGVSVSDDASGRITVHIALAGPITNTAGFGIFLDTDMNGQTHDATGRAIVLAVTSNMVVPVVMSGADDSQLQVPVTATISGNDVSASFQKTDMAIDKMFGFWAASMKDDLSGTADEAPDGNTLWVYMLTGGQQTTSTTTSTTTTTTTTQTNVAKAVIGAPKVAGRMAAGMHISVSFPVTRSDTGGPLTTGKMICDPSVQGEVIAHAESFTGGTAKLSFTIPKTAKGKLLKVKVTIKAGNQSTTRIATFHIN
jgi:hypothetical protein